MILPRVSVKRFRLFEKILLCALSGLLAACVASRDVLETAREATERVRSEHAPDSRVARFEVEPELHGEGIRLRGETNLPKAKSALLALFRELRLPAEDRIVLLPHPEMGRKVRALVNVSVANLRSEARHSAELVTQATLGLPLRVLKRQGDFYLVQTPDSYIAWVDRGGIELLSTQRYEEVRSSEKVVYLEALGFARSEADPRADTVSDLVMGAILFLEGESAGFWRVRFPDGRKAWIAQSEAARYEEWLERSRPTGERLIATARKLLGVPYLWGGTSAKAVDCSGLVRNTYFLAGLILPRDSTQQVQCGESVGDEEDFGSLRPGDLLFFGRRAKNGTERVRHVGMWIGGGRYIHAFGRVRVSSFDPSDPAYDEFNRQRYLRAKRILGRERAGVRDLRASPLY